MTLGILTSVARIKSWPTATSQLRSGKWYEMVTLVLLDLLVSWLNLASDIGRTMQKCERIGDLGMTRQTDEEKNEGSGTHRGGERNRESDSRDFNPLSCALSFHSILFSSCSLLTALQHERY